MNHQIDTQYEQNTQNNTTRRARVTAVHRERYALSLDGNTIYGRLKAAAWRESGALYPTVGDWVEITPNPQGDALITALEPRRTLFRRSDGFGKRGRGQRKAREKNQRKNAFHDGFSLQKKCDAFALARRPAENQFHLDCIAKCFECKL